MHSTMHIQAQKYCVQVRNPSIALDIPSLVSMGCTYAPLAFLLHILLLLIVPLIQGA
jgi:hypothetical protein